MHEKRHKPPSVNGFETSVTRKAIYNRLHELQPVRQSKKATAESWQARIQGVFVTRVVLRTRTQGSNMNAKALNALYQPKEEYVLMARRALWKGQLRLSLVSIPVELYAAQDASARVSFRQIHRPSGKRVHYDKTVTGIGPVKADDIVKGYESDGDYILLDPEEIEEIKLETKKTLELVQFVGACEISPLYFDKPYYLVPSDDLAEDAYRVIRDALRATEKVGLGQMTMRGKEYLVAIKPCGDGLLLETLYYADELHDSEPMFSSIKDEKADDELLELATALIDKKTAPFDAENFTDHYAKALTSLIESKKKNRKTPRVSVDEDERPTGENVVDLMAALKKSLASGGSKAKPAAKSDASKGGKKAS